MLLIFFIAHFRSGLEQNDIRVLYSYLTTSLFPACIELACPSRLLSDVF